MPTPNHPEYPAAHGCGAGAVAEALHRFYGSKQVSFEFNSTVTGTTHHFDTTDALVHEMIDARVWGGMHFRSSVETGVRMGKQVAHWIVQHEFEPEHTHEDACAPQKCRPVQLSSCHTLRGSAVVRDQLA